MFSFFQSTWVKRQPVRQKVPIFTVSPAECGIASGRVLSVLRQESDTACRNGVGMLGPLVFALSGFCPYIGNYAMKIDADEVRRVAALSRLALTDAEVDRFAAQLSSILDYVSKLNELDTDGVEPTSHVMPLSAPLREDLPERPLSREAALANGPAHDEFAFIVPRVI